MKVVFLENVPNVARAGEVKEVSNGFGRNYLLPRKLATLATPAEMKRLEQERAVAARREARLGAQAHNLAAQITEQTVVIKARVGKDERLYGSITSQQIAETLAQQVGQSIDRRRLELEEPLRKLGTYKIPLQLTREVTATVTVIVEGPQGERATQPEPVQVTPAATAPAAEPEAEAEATEEESSS